MSLRRDVVLMVALLALGASCSESEPCPEAAPCPEPTVCPEAAACPPAEEAESAMISKEAWDAWAALATGTPSGSGPSQPQVDPGTIGISTTGDIGAVYVKDLGAGSRREVFIVEDTSAYRSTAVKTLREWDEEALRTYNGNTPLNGPEAIASACRASTGCSDSDSACLADLTYHFGAFPLGTMTHPEGNVFILNTTLHKDLGCDGQGIENLGVSAWVHRTRAQVNGQARWVEHWFVRKQAGGAGVAKWAAPDLCRDPNGGSATRELLVKVEAPAVGSPPSLTAFRDQLKDPNCTGKAWCNFCEGNGTQCDHTQVVLEWWDVATACPARGAP